MSSNDADDEGFMSGSYDTDDTNETNETTNTHDPYPDAAAAPDDPHDSDYGEDNGRGDDVENAPEPIPRALEEQERRYTSIPHRLRDLAHNIGLSGREHGERRIRRLHSIASWKDFIKVVYHDREADWEDILDDIQHRREPYQDAPDLSAPFVGEWEEEIEVDYDETTYDWFQHIGPNNFATWAVFAGENDPMGILLASIFEYQLYDRPRVPARNLRGRVAPYSLDKMYQHYYNVMLCHGRRCGVILNGGINDPKLCFPTLRQNSPVWARFKKRTLGVFAGELFGGINRAPPLLPNHPVTRLLSNSFEPTTQGQRNKLVLHFMRQNGCRATTAVHVKKNDPFYQSTTGSISFENKTSKKSSSLQSERALNLTGEAAEACRKHIEFGDFAECNHESHCLLGGTSVVSFCDAMQRAASIASLPERFGRPHGVRRGHVTEDTGNKLINGEISCVNENYECIVDALEYRRKDAHIEPYMHSSLQRAKLFASDPEVTSMNDLSWYCIYPGYRRPESVDGSANPMPRQRARFINFEEPSYVYSVFVSRLYLKTESEDVNLMRSKWERYDDLAGQGLVGIWGGLVEPEWWANGNPVHDEEAAPLIRSQRHIWTDQANVGFMRARTIAMLKKLGKALYCGVYQKDEQLEEGQEQEVWRNDEFRSIVEDARNTRRRKHGEPADLNYTCYVVMRCVLETGLVKWSDLADDDYSIFNQEVSEQLRAYFRLEAQYMMDMHDEREAEKLEMHDLSASSDIHSAWKNHVPAAWRQRSRPYVVARGYVLFLHDMSEKQALYVKQQKDRDAKFRTFDVNEYRRWRLQAPIAAAAPVAGDGEEGEHEQEDRHIRTVQAAEAAALNAGNPLHDSNDEPFQLNEDVPLDSDRGSSDESDEYGLEDLPEETIRVGDRITYWESPDYLSLSRMSALVMGVYPSHRYPLKLSNGHMLHITRKISKEYRDEEGNPSHGPSNLHSRRRWMHEFKLVEGGLKTKQGAKEFFDLFGDLPPHLQEQEEGPEEGVSVSV